MLLQLNYLNKMSRDFKMVQNITGLKTTYLYYIVRIMP